MSVMVHILGGVVGDVTLFVLNDQAYIARFTSLRGVYRFQFHLLFVSLSLAQIRITMFKYPRYHTITFFIIRKLSNQYLIFLKIHCKKLNHKTS